MPRYQNKPMKEVRVKRSRGRVEGDALYYFFWHNLFSLVIFFAFALNLGLFEHQTETISDLISVEFLSLVLIIFGISLLSGLMGRIMAYLIVRLYFNIARQSETKTFGEFNTGINKLSFSFLIQTFLSSVIFATGIIFILQSKLFDSNSIWALLATYIIVKIAVFLLTRLISETKL